MPFQRGLSEQADAHYQSRRWEKALEAYDALLRENPYNGEFQFRLGEIHYHLKNFQASTKAYEVAIELGYRVPHAMFSIGRNFAVQNRPGAAVRWLEKPIRYSFAVLKHLEESPDLENVRNHRRFMQLLPPKISGDVSRTQGWRTDLEYMAKRMEQGHYNLFGKVSRKAWNAAIKRLHGEIPELDDHEVITGFMKIVALAGDGHTCLIFPPPARFQFLRIPVMFYWFKDGVFITAAAPKYKNAVGSRVVSIGEVPIERVLNALQEVVSRDNDMALKWLGPFLLTFPGILHGLRISTRTDQLAVTLEIDRGQRSVVSFEAEPNGDPLHYRTARPGWITARDDSNLPTPLWLKDPDNHYWFEYLEKPNLVYFQFNQVRDKPDDPLPAFCGRLFEFINSHGVEGLIMDIRLNNGGNLLLNRNLIHGIITCRDVNQKDRLFTIIGRRTFSAAMHLAAQLEMHTRTLFVGEPTGSSPNFVGEDNHFVLPYSGLEVSASNLAWQGSWAFDHRVWIAPDIAAELTSGDFKSDRDPAMDAILTCLAEQG